MFNPVAILLGSTFNSCVLNPTPLATNVIALLLFNFKEKPPLLSEVAPLRVPLITIEIPSIPLLSF